MSQRKTILITGTSSGIGRATAFHFQRKGWQVIATMRSPEHETELNRLPGVICLGLDVNDDALEALQDSDDDAIDELDEFAVDDTATDVE